MKGTHHFITCQDYDEMHNFNDDLDTNFAILCSDPARKTDIADLTNRMIVKPQTADNLKVSFLAMDCAYQYTYFSTKTIDANFNKHCVNVAAGERVEIRIASPYTYFNITNIAHFENIDFTGEDLFASALHNKATMGF